MRVCLRHHAGGLAHTRVTTAASELDSLARRATGGAVAVVFEVTSVTPRGLNRATVAVEHTEQAGRTTLARYRSVYKALGGNPDGLVERYDNAVVAYQLHPSRKQRALVERCLR